MGLMLACKMAHEFAVEAKGDVENLAMGRWSRGDALLTRKRRK